MKLYNCFFALICLCLFTACYQWEEWKPSPVLVKEDNIIKFYNNGDSTLVRMTLSKSVYYPVEDWTLLSNISKEKVIDYDTPAPEWYREILYPQDSIISWASWDCYIGCIRYAKFAVYDKDDSSSDGYRLRKQYIVNDTIRQKYEQGEYKYPDKTTLIVNWPEDSLLFK